MDMSKRIKEVEHKIKSLRLELESIRKGYDEMVSPPDTIKLFLGNGAVTCVGVINNTVGLSAFARPFHVCQIGYFKAPIKNSDYYFKEITREEAEKINEIVFVIDNETTSFGRVTNYRIINAGKHTAIFGDNVGIYCNGASDWNTYFKIVKKPK